MALQALKLAVPAEAYVAAGDNGLGATFSPDGKYVYFAGRKQSFTYNAIFPLWQLVRRNLGHHARR